MNISQDDPKPSTSCESILPLEDFKQQDFKATESSIYNSDQGAQGLKRKRLFADDERTKNTKKPRRTNLGTEESQTHGIREENIQTSPYFDEKNTYAASGLKQSLHGNIYQLKHLMLALHRAWKSGYPFRLSTEMNAAEKFDDLVLQYRENTGMEVHRFVQFKHKQDQSKDIRVGDLLAQEDGEFSLQKYFISWRRIRKCSEFTRSVFKHFILCTNIGIDIRGLEKAGIDCRKVTESDRFLKTNRTEQPPRYKLSAGSKSKMYNKLRGTSDACKLAMTLAQRVHNSKIIDLRNDIFKLYHIALAQEVLDIRNNTFRCNFSRNNNLSKKAKKFRELFFLNMMQLSKGDVSEMDVRKNLEARTLKLSMDFGKEFRLSGDNFKAELPDDVIDDEEISDFLNNFILAVNQPNEIELGEMITSEIGADSQFNLLHADVVGDSFQKMMLDWFKERDGKFLSHENARVFFDELKCKISSIITIGMNLAYSEKLKNYDVHFRENSELHKFLSSIVSTGPQIFNIISFKYTLLTALRVYQTVVQLRKHRNKDSFVFIRLKTLLRTEITSRVISAFETPKSHHLLIVNCGEETTENTNSMKLWTALCTIMRENCHKKMVIITHGNNNTINQLEIDVEICQERDDEISFNNLTKSSQRKLLEKPIINFQGREQKTSFRRLLDISDPDNIETENFEDFGKIIDPSTLVRLINNEEIRIGSQMNTLEEIEDYYIPRTISHRVVINQSIFTTEDIPDLLAVSGSHEVKALFRNGRHSKNFEILDNGRENDQFKILCEQNTERNIHWLYGESDILLWKQSVGEITNLVDYRIIDGDDSAYVSDLRSNQNFLLQSRIKNYFPDENGSTNGSQESIDQLVTHNENRKIVIISDKAGMGKTTAMTYLANKLVKNESCLLVVMIELNHFTTVLAEEQRNPSFERKDTEKTIDFFVEKFLSFKTDLELTIVKKMISLHGKAVLFFDGFDEISPKYTDSVIELLQAFAELPIKKLFVTTRPHTRIILEQKLNTFSYTMQTFSPINQIEFLTKFWRKKLNLNRNDELIKQRLKQYAEAVMKVLAKSIDDCRNELTGVPLQTRLVAEVFGIHGDGEQGDFQVCEDFLHSVDNEPKLPDKIDLIYLYRNFVNRKYDIYRKEKKKEDLTNLGVEEDSEDLREIFLKSHQVLALCALFREEVLRDLLTSQQKICSAALVDKNKGRERTGIVTQIVNDRPHFIHLTFAEYFAATFFINRLNNYDRNEQMRKFFIADILLKPEYRIIRAFLNYLMLDGGKSLTDELWKSTIMSERRGTGVGTIFHVAALEGNEQIIRFFLNCFREYLTDRKTLINAEDYYHQTAVMVAAKYGHWKELRVLVEYGDAEVNCVSSLEETPLYAAALSGNVDMLKYLFEKGANPHDRMKYGEPEGETLLHVVAFVANSLEVVKCLVEGGADVNARDWQSMTPLHKAIQAAEPTRHMPSSQRDAGANSSDSESRARDIVEYLLEKGADVNPRDKNGNTPLYNATMIIDELDILRCLIKNGADVDSQSDNNVSPLHVAVYLRKLNMVKYLLEEGAKPDCQTMRGSTPLHFAITSNYLEIVECLIDGGANINCRDAKGDTPLLLAAVSGTCNAIKCLLENGAIVDCQDNYGWTPLSVAIIHARNLDVVRCLVEGHAEINFQNSFGITALHTATSAEQVDIMHYLIENGSDVHCRDHNGRTPLHEATSTGNQDVVRYLLNKQAGTEFLDEYEWSYPHEATLARRLDVVKCLLEEAVDCQNGNQWTLTHDIIARDNWYVMKHLYEETAEVRQHKKYRWMALSEAELANKSKQLTYFTGTGHDFDAVIQDDNRRSSLYTLIDPCNFHFVNKMYSMRVGASDSQDKYRWAQPSVAALAIRLDVVECLVNKGADVNCQDEDGVVPLHKATTAGNLYVVQYLLEKGADVQCQDNYGRTPLHNAVYADHLDIVEYLVDEGANVNCQDQDGATPLHEASAAGSLHLVQYLVENGADVECQDKHGWTPLHDAVYADHLDIVEYLVDEGANVNCQDQDGATPLHEASSIGNLNIVKFLVRGGANINTEDKNLQTPLDNATSNRKLEVLTYLKYETGVN